MQINQIHLSIKTYVASFTMMPNASSQLRRHISYYIVIMFTLVIKLNCYQRKRPTRVDFHSNTMRYDDVLHVPGLSHALWFR